MVDLALSIRPDERRRLFEEAAGIGLYRSRKEEALRRLETTQRNLERVSDIIDEIRPRLRSLEKQSARVGEYKLVQENLKNNLREWYGYQWMVAQSQLENTRELLSGAEASLSESKKAVDGDRQRIEVLRQEVDQKRTAIDQLMSDRTLQWIQLQTRRSQFWIGKRSAEIRGQLVMDWKSRGNNHERRKLGKPDYEQSRQEQELASLSEKYKAANIEFETLSSKTL